MFIINFFNNRDLAGATQIISDYFGIDYDDVFYELCTHCQSNYNILDFIKKFNIDMKHSFYNKTYITCRHAMTAFDGLEYLRKNGLLNLKQMLERKTPLYMFLLENNIKIDVENKVIFYKDEIYNILSANEICTSCIFNEYQCKSFLNKNMPDYKNCDYRENLGFLEGKLYYDKCETEVFVDGTLKDIYNYSSIRYSPEILNTIEQITCFYDNGMGDLKGKWRHRTNCKYYILEFNVDINNFEYISNKVMYEGYWEISEVLDMFGYDENDFDASNVSPILYQNLFVLNRLINNFIWGSGKKYGQLLPTTIIEGNSIRVVREHNVNDRVKEDI